MSASDKFVFFLRGPADVDQMTPVIWQCLKNDVEVLAVIASEYPIDSDFRLAFLTTLNGFQVRAMPQLNADAATNRSLRALRPLWCYYRVRRMLQKEAASLCVFEWGDGIWPNSKISSPTAFIRRRFFAEFVLQAQYACASLGIPTVSLPHGHSTKLTLIRSTSVLGVLDANTRKLPFSNRSSFAKYVFAAQYHRDVIVENSDISPANIEVWGSARFSPEWTRILYEISPPADLPKHTAQQTCTVLFFVPKWRNLIDRPMTIKLLIALAAVPTIQLVIKGHIRGSESHLTETEIAAISAGGSAVFPDHTAPSTSLIAAADVLIDADSSIAFDAINLGKLYIRPRYLQQDSVKTVFDRYGAALQADSQDQIIGALSRVPLPVIEVSDEFRREVIGDVSTNIPFTYYQRLRAVARPAHGF